MILRNDLDNRVDCPLKLFDDIKLPLHLLQEIGQCVKSRVNGLEVVFCLLAVGLGVDLSEEMIDIELLPEPDEALLDRVYKILVLSLQVGDLLLQTLHAFAAAFDLVHQVDDLICLNYLVTLCPLPLSIFFEIYYLYTVLSVFPSSSPTTQPLSLSICLLMLPSICCSLSSLLGKLSLGVAWRKVKHVCGYIRVGDLEVGRTGLVGALLV